MVQLDRTLQCFDPFAILWLLLVVFELPFQISIGGLLAGHPLVEDMLLKKLLATWNGVCAFLKPNPYSEVFPCRRPSCNKLCGAPPVTVRPHGLRSDFRCWRGEGGPGAAPSGSSGSHA